MNEFQKELARCNLSCEFLAQLRADSGVERIRAAHAIARFSRGLSEAEMSEARNWARNIHDMELANRAKWDAATQ